jgi:uncharacterized damage-inducible protein DinB
MFVDEADDPRDQDPGFGDERATLMEYLRYQRQTLELKCSGLDAAALAQRSVPPSTMSLLGLVRHLAQVEQAWFRRRMAGLDVPRLYSTDAEPDADFDGAVADPAVVAAAWEAWREEAAFTDRFVDQAADLDVRGDVPGRGPVPLREVLVHLVEEYARHLGHADLLRERVDGRVGQ